MKRAIWISALGVLAFVIILLVRMPARWLAGALPAGVTCTQITGTIWNGLCSGLGLGSSTLGDLTWQLHPARLLTGKLASRLALNGPAATAVAEVTAELSGDITARKVRASFPLDPALLPQLAANFRGQARFDLGLLRIERGLISVLTGRIEVKDLEQRGSSQRMLGDYVLSFPAARARNRDGEPVGDLRSVRGPLDVQGTLRLTREPGFELEGVIAAGPGASPELIQELSMLGTPDSRGRRPFSLAGTF